MSMKSMKSNNHQSTLQSKRSEALTWAKEMMINESKQMNKKFSLFLLLLKLSNGSIRKKWKQENEESVFFLFNDYKQSAASCWLPKKKHIHISKISSTLKNSLDQQNLSISQWPFLIFFYCFSSMLLIGCWDRISNPTHDDLNSTRRESEEKKVY